MKYSHAYGQLTFRQQRLKAFLEIENINSNIPNMGQIQKTVYDAKCTGTELGYMFAEYPSRGMFSPELRNDIERLNGVYYYDPAD